MSFCKNFNISRISNNFKQLLYVSIPFPNFHDFSTFSMTTATLFYRVAVCGRQTCWVWQWKKKRTKIFMNHVMLRGTLFVGINIYPDITPTVLQYSTKSTAETTFSDTLQQVKHESSQDTGMQPTLWLYRWIIRHCRKDHLWTEIMFATGTHIQYKFIVLC